MYFPERLVPKRSGMESWNEPPLGPPSFSRSKFKSRPTLFPVVKPCRRPLVGLPRASVTNAKVGVMPCSSSQLRTPYVSLSRCWRDRIRGCDRQVHGVTVIGPLGAVFAGGETDRVGPRIPSIRLIHHCCREATDMEVVAVVREAG